MRKPQKSKLRQYLLNKRPSIITNEIEVCVVDGGALLHKVKWKAKVTYRDVCQQYLEFVKRIYGKYATVCVVFDGYNAESASIKAHEHQRRHDGFCIDVQVSPDIEVTTSSERFLLNGNNKQQFITLLCTILEENGYSTQQSEGDADVLIVETALEYCSSQNVVVLADDTDILVMLMYHMRPEYNDMYFGTSVREEAKLGKKLATWKIKDLCEAEDMTSYLLFAHAWTGCDTTSAIHNKGKTKILQMLKQSEELRETISCFGMLESTQEEVAKAGYKVFISNFNGKKSDTLTSLRYASFMSIVSKCSQLQPENLPPIERAAFYHSLRVHLQVCQWKELQLDVLDAAKWGWNLVDKCLVPVKTDQPCAPDWLMQFIHCNCKLTSKYQCGTRLCTCRKNGLSCVQACGDSRGESCNNSDMDAGNICDDSNEENDFEENL